MTARTASQSWNIFVNKANDKQTNNKQTFTIEVVVEMSRVDHAAQRSAQRAHMVRMRTVLDEFELDESISSVSCLQSFSMSPHGRGVRVTSRSRRD